MKTFLRLSLLALLASTLSACAAASMAGLQKPGVHSDGQQLLDLRTQQIELEQRIEQVQATAGGPEASCDNICGWSAGICDLAERICGIAARHPAEPDFQGACDEAKARCAKAKEKTTVACACSGP